MPNTSQRFLPSDYISHSSLCPTLPVSLPQSLLTDHTLTSQHSESCCSSAFNLRPTFTKARAELTLPSHPPPPQSRPHHVVQVQPVPTGSLSLSTGVRYPPTGRTPAQCVGWRAQGYRPAAAYVPSLPHPLASTAADTRPSLLSLPRHHNRLLQLPKQPHLLNCYTPRDGQALSALPAGPSPTSAS